LSFLAALDFYFLSHGLYAAIPSKGEQGKEGIKKHEQGFLAPRSVALNAVE